MHFQRNALKREETKSSYSQWHSFLLCASAGLSGAVVEPTDWSVRSFVLFVCAALHLRTYPPFAGIICALFRLCKNARPELKVKDTKIRTLKIEGISGGGGGGGGRSGGGVRECLYACVCVRVYVYLCVWLGACVCALARLCVCEYVSAGVRACVRACACVREYVRARECVRARARARVCVCVCERERERVVGACARVCSFMRVCVRVCILSLSGAELLNILKDAHLKRKKVGM